jgi:hypothetical protein
VSWFLRAFRGGGREGSERLAVKKRAGSDFGGAARRSISDEIRFIRFRHDMYEFVLLHAAQDSLRATQLLSNDANAYILTGECLAKLRKLKECVN